MLALISIAVDGCRPRDGARPEETSVRRGGDLLVGRDNVALRDTVPGDVIVAGGSIGFTGSAGGDFLGAGGEQRISGRIAGSVRAAGGDVQLQAAVGRNVALAGGHVDLEQSAVIAGNAYLAGGEIEVDGAVNGFLEASGGEISLDGTIGRDARVRARRLRIGPGARIGGNLEHNVATGNLTIDPAAQIAGEVIARRPPTRTFLWVLRVAWYLGFLATGAIAVALFPRLADAARQSITRRPWAAVGFGVLWIIAMPVAAALVAITIVGIPLALILFALYVISLYLGRAVVALWLGRFLLGSRARPERTGLVLSFLGGGLVLLLLSIVPLVGGMITLIATLVGLGAGALVLARRSVETVPS
ncbi:MAG: hypothetical protein GEU90_20240 [Gemmatimonas sp.]|nr:hypothetical protein [Gemmatimonas sp.]